MKKMNKQKGEDTLFFISACTQKKQNLNKLVKLDVLKTDS